MKKDTINTLFESLEGGFDIHETPSGHQIRFLEKLQVIEKPTSKVRNWVYPLSIAASIAALVIFGFFFQSEPATQANLASVSPKMEQTESFFVSTINDELLTLKSFETSETETLIKDALTQISILEVEYEGLKTDLVSSGNDKRVIYAMINNFQNRIDLLQQVITTIEQVKALKANRDETTI